ncbi:AAA family ATPase [Protaetiibacter larvae]|uniref:AAA family ATPase n=1 Tax=Protaetiibacter larvae TaxID=2592654 RepID=A0A5C1Y8Q8_9MICO|nr:AAA family ATPase [Protaetiibacter larvae]QEO09332.1 AAA family ATPase [Protaetiibacter larvae]
MTTRTLRDTVAAADAERFAGRDAEFATVRELLDPAGERRVLYVHGAGGIGKSALLRATARAAEADGYQVAAHDARTLPGELAPLVERVLEGGTARRCIVIDEVDALGAALRPLRDALLDSLGDDSRIVFAGRAAPDPSWHDHGLPAVVVELLLHPLADEHATALLAASGVTDDERQEEIVAWAQGSPLALTVAAAAPAGTPGSLESELEGRLTAWLAGQSMLDADPAVLEVAALTRVVDARLIAAALPGRSTRDAMRALAALPVVERLGPGLTMHPVLASAMRARLRATAPGRYRELVHRVALHLGGRARLGDIDALIELSQFIEGEEYRRSFSNRPSATHYADAAAPGEFPAFGRANGYDEDPGWDELLAWDASPDLDFVMRRWDGTALLYNRFTKVSRLPRLGPITEALAESARLAGVDPERSFAGVSLFADASLRDRAEASRLSTGAFMYRVDMPDVEAILIHFPRGEREPGLNAAVSRAASGPGVPAVTITDFRPVGAVGFVEALVLREQGYPSRTGAPRDLLASDQDLEREARLREVLDRVFDQSGEDRRLRQAIELAHFGPRRRESELLAAMHVSRPTWYRLLRRARERVLGAAGELPPVG